MAVVRNDPVALYPQGLLTLHAFLNQRSFWCIHRWEHTM
ncbi:hypothetical protein SLEP1_g30158 [Rubroshorea leprosula]|uniref:Uncharacterized protein n=1 Tax=Rubroshorea leprosula TaxID=152421 RepID=A0AAV5JZ71_9ROSI|nr:hypothetical protein SLEP1_g30158 [Rubroshorea leprosula]